MNKGDIVLIKFPFTDFSEAKSRPVIVLGVNRDDLLVCFIGSSSNDMTETDLLLKKDQSNGLKVDSIAKCFKLYTLHASLIERKIGMVNETIYSLIVKKIVNLIE